MNIFYSDEDPVKAAQNLDSKRVIKMILESAQLMSNSLIRRGFKAPYDKTHYNHPASLAVDWDRHNYMWLLEHFKALLNEYTFRYGKKHSCEQWLEIFEEKAPDGTSNVYDTVTMPNCTKFKEEKDIIKAYRMALLDKWANDKVKPKWAGPEGHRGPPEWAIDAPWFTLYSNYRIHPDD